MKLTKDGRAVEIEREEHVAAYVANGWKAVEAEAEAEAEAKPKRTAKAKDDEE